MSNHATTGACVNTGIGDGAGVRSSGTIGLTHSTSTLAVSMADVMAARLRKCRMKVALVRRLDIRYWCSCGFRCLAGLLLCPSFTSGIFLRLGTRKRLVERSDSVLFTVAGYWCVSINISQDFSLD